MANFSHLKRSSSPRVVHAWSRCVMFSYLSLYFREINLVSLVLGIKIRLMLIASLGFSKKSLYIRRGVGLQVSSKAAVVVHSWCRFYYQALLPLRHHWIVIIQGFYVFGCKLNFWSSTQQLQSIDFSRSATSNSNLFKLAVTVTLWNSQSTIEGETSLLL